MKSIVDSQPILNLPTLLSPTSFSIMFHITVALAAD